MLNILKEAMIIILSVIGIIYIFRLFFTFILRSKNDRGVYVVVPIDDTIECAEQLIRSTAERTIFMGKSRWDRIVCIDYGTSDETKQIIQKLCDYYGFIDYMTADEFKKVFCEAIT